MTWKSMTERPRYSKIQTFDLRGVRPSILASLTCEESLLQLSIPAGGDVLLKVGQGCTPGSIDIVSAP
jgi:hypothetical protein